MIRIPLLGPIPLPSLEWAGLLSAGILTLMLAACTGGLKGSDTGGDLGGSDEKSPGDLYVQLATEYYRLGQLETALARANQAVKLDPKNAQGHSLLALIYQRLGQYPLAEKHYRQAIAIKPNDPYILNSYAGYLCGRRMYAEADIHFKKALENPLYTKPWLILTNMGTCAKRSGSSVKAQSYFERALKGNPRFAPALEALAEINYERSNYRSAKTYLDRYFQVAQPGPEVLLLAVRVERKLGARKRAATYAELLRKNYPDSPRVTEL